MGVAIHFRPRSRRITILLSIGHLPIKHFPTLGQRERHEARASHRVTIANTCVTPTARPCLSASEPLVDQVHCFTNVQPSSTCSPNPEHRKLSVRIVAPAHCSRSTRGQPARSLRRAGVGTRSRRIAYTRRLRCPWYYRTNVCPSARR